MKQDRLVRVNRLIQECLADTLPLVRDPRVTRPVVLSVTAVRTSPDLRHAKVYLSVSGPPDEQAAALAGLEHARGFLRGELGQSVRLRFLPELHFFLDETIENATKIEQILRELASEGGQRVEQQPGQEADSAEKDSAPERERREAEGDEAAGRGTD
jgi:ribosome-binding factor A